jgi:hypothetical protein
MPNKDSALIPLGLVQEYSRKYSKVWELADMFRNAPTLSGMWDKRRCYIPIAAGIAIMEKLKMPYSGLYMVPALAAWRQSKEVYTFDPDLADALYAQVSDTKIPCNVLMRLPFYCVYIDSDKYRFFCHLENDANDGRWELRFVRICDNGEMVASYLHLGDFTLEESIAAGADESLYQMERLGGSDGVSALLSKIPGGQRNEYADVFDGKKLAEMLQLVLYICADNADIVQPDENKKTYRERKPGETPREVKDKYREVRKWETGFYVGSTLRKERSGGNYEKQPYQGGTKRPHMRRGHWHHYWKGKEGNRELVLHWVLPIFVNGEESGDEDRPARITPVR